MERDGPRPGEGDGGAARDDSIGGPRTAPRGRPGPLPAAPDGGGQPPGAPAARRRRAPARPAGDARRRRLSPLEAAAQPLRTIVVRVRSRGGGRARRGQVETTVPRGAAAGNARRESRPRRRWVSRSTRRPRRAVVSSLSVEPAIPRRGTARRPARDAGSRRRERWRRRRLRGRRGRPWLPVCASRTPADATGRGSRQSADRPACCAAAEPRSW
jgi:hypothetical protein